MIDKTRATKPALSDKTKKVYWLVMDAHNPVGVCTSLDAARIGQAEVARERDARLIDGTDIYVYQDGMVNNYITIQCVRRMKPSR